MSKLMIRLIAVLLATSLMADPLTAVPLYSFTNRAPASSTSKNVFQEQALSAAVLSMRTTFQSLKRSLTFRMAKVELSHVLIASGLGWKLATAISTFVVTYRYTGSLRTAGI